MAEIELSILSRQCLDRRIPDQVTLTQEVSAWQEKRNVRACPMDCSNSQFNPLIQLEVILNL